MEETVDVGGLLAASRKAFAEQDDAPKIVVGAPSPDIDEKRAAHAATAFAGAAEDNVL